MDDLASVWCGWAEMELNHEEFDKALEAVQRAVAEPAAAVQRRRLQASQSRDEKRRAVAEVYIYFPNLGFRAVVSLSHRARGTVWLPSGLASLRARG